MRHLRTIVSGLAAVLLTVQTGACVRQGPPVYVRSGPANVAPALVVERFLQAANANDIQTMGLLFGTPGGSVLKRDPRAEVEQRMFALASLLRHDDFALEGEGIVPGRIGEAVQIIVRLTQGTRQVAVPFLVVTTRNDGWLVEQIDIEALTAGG